MSDREPIAARDVTRFRLFRARVEEMRGLGVMTAPPDEYRVDASFEKDGSVSATLEGYSADPLRSFLVALRQFLNQQDDIQFYGICNALQRALDGDAERARAADARARWKSILNHAFPKLELVRTVDGNETRELIDTAASFKLVLYGAGVIHTKVAEAQRWERLTEMSQKTALFLVHRALPRLFACLEEIDAVIDAWFATQNVTAPNEATDSGEGC